MTDTGIGLLVYNRPEHTQAVLNGLKQNDIDYLYIFSDGPATVDDQPAIERTRDIIRDVSWCETELITYERNRGLREAQLSCFEHILERHDRIVYIEDDCVPAKDFMNFVSQALDEYSDTDRVMNIQGYSPPIRIPRNYEYDGYFTRRSGSWGLATWQDAWEQYSRDANEFREFVKSDQNVQKLNQAGKGLKQLLEKDIQGEISSPQAWWSYTLVRNDGLSLSPVESRVANIGHDGSGTHSGDHSRYDVNLPKTESIQFNFPPEPSLNELINRRYNRYTNARGRKDYYFEVLKDLFSRLKPV